MSSVQVRVAQARGTMEGLRAIGEDLLGAGVQAAPVREGTLRGSFELAFLVNGQRFEGAGAYQAALANAVALARAGALRSLDVEVSANTVYAARQHEEMDWHHPLGGGPKYLERPLAERAPRYAPIIDAAQRRAVDRAR